MSLHPHGGNVADLKTDRLAGFDQHAGRNQLLHDHAGNRRPYGQFGADRRALLLRLVDLLRRDAENAQRLQAVLDIGSGIVVVRYAAFVVLDGHHPVIQHLFHAVDDSLVELLAVAGLAIGRDGVGDVGTGDVEQRLVLLDGCADVHQNPRDRPVYLRDGLRGVILVPIHGAGSVDSHPQEVRVTGVIFKWES